LKTFQDYYVKKDYVNALKVLTDHGQVLPKSLYHYNLGTVQAQLGKLAEARANLLIADHEGFDSPELRENLTFVENALEIPRLENSIGVTDYLVKGSLFASQGAFTTLFLLILLAGLAGIRKTPSFKKLMLVIGVAVIPVCFNVVTLLWPRHIILKQQPLLEGPSTLFTTVQEIPAGVMIMGTQNGEWIKIFYPSRFAGWIQDKNLKGIN